MRPPRIVAALATVAAVVWTASSVAAYPRPGRTHVVSLAPDGSPANSPLAGLYPAISSSGRYVSFWSLASNLVADDTNDLLDLFVHDIREGLTERVSVSTGGVQANGGSFSSAVSADGRYVVFEGDASNLVPGDTNNTRDMFVRDRTSGTTERVSVSSSETQGNSISADRPLISDGGRYVVFTSLASNLAAGDTNGLWDVFLRDRVAGTTERVSLGPGGVQGNLGSFWPAMSTDARYVAFASDSSSFAPAKSNTLAADVYLRDRVAGTTERVSLSTDGIEADGHSSPIGVSDDGRFVAFWSDGPNLVPEDTNGVADIFVRDLALDRTVRASVAGAGEQANGESAAQYGGASLSADGRFVTFSSRASNLVPGDTNGSLAVFDVFVHDLVTGATERIVADDGSQPNSAVMSPGVSSDGRFVSFNSSSTNLVPGGTSGNSDAFVRDRGPALGVTGLAATRVGDQIDVSGTATFSGGLLSSATDPAGDAGVDPRTGADLVGGGLAYRPEEGVLTARLELASLLGGRPAALGFGCSYLSRNGACPGGVAGGAGVLFGLRFRTAGTLYELRALRAGASGVPPAVPFFALYRCAPSCVEVARLTGGFGTTGTAIVASIPLGAAGLAEGSVLTELRAFTGLGEAAVGTVEPFDEAALPDVVIPGTKVELGVAPAGTPPDEVVFDTPALVNDGRFTGALDASSLGAGDLEVWARACLDEECGAASVALAGI